MCPSIIFDLTIFRGSFMCHQNTDTHTHRERETHTHTHTHTMVYALWIDKNRLTRF